ncbi:RidA family protein [soil metagenome]
MSAPPYSPFYRSGEWGCVSGQIGITADGLPDSFGDQLRQVFVNLQQLLSDNGVRSDQIAKTTVFLTDMENYAELNEIYLGFFGDHRPARSAVAVAGLPFGALVEIEAWVHLSD